MTSTQTTPFRGEHVLDVPPELGARVRLLGSGRTDKNDPSDARGGDRGAAVSGLLAGAGR